MLVTQFLLLGFVNRADSQAGIQDSLEDHKMNKLTAVIVATTLMSGCGGYPRYSVVRGSDG
jgi:hypothetical protein